MAHKFNDAEIRALIKDLKKLQPPKIDERICTVKNCEWKPRSGGKCVLPKCFKGM